MTDVKNISILHKEPYTSFLFDAIPAYRQGKYVQIVVLRETKSHAIFTTEGRTLDVEVLQSGIENTAPIDRIIMYKRKQIAPERRTGRATSRAHGYSPKQDIFTDKKSKKPRVKQGECEIMGNSCGECADCVLYGFAATTGTNSQKARILTDSGFVIRPQDQVMRDMTLNAIKETTEGGIAGSAFASRENLLPQVFIPTVETLVDVTPHELIYVLGNILRTTRYGAESNREGFVRNHILEITFSDTEIYSNLELTQLYYDALYENDTIPNYLNAPDLIEKWNRQVGEQARKKVFGRTEIMSGEDLNALLSDAQALFSTENSLQLFLQQIHEQAFGYAHNVRGQSDDGDGDA